MAAISLYVSHGLLVIPAPHPFDVAQGGVPMWRAHGRGHSRRAKSTTGDTRNHRTSPLETLHRTATADHGSTSRHITLQAQSDQLIDLPAFTAWVADTLNLRPPPLPHQYLIRDLGLTDFQIMTLIMGLDQLLTDSGPASANIYHSDRTLRELHLYYLTTQQQPPPPTF